MDSSPLNKQVVLSLRERKKLATHLAIQREALRLFKEQGYEATTVEQIAAAAEVSHTTFFRYFPTKQDVVLHDALDPVAMASLEAQPAALAPIEALRRALREVYVSLSSEELAAERERQALIRATPELWVSMLTGVTGALDLLCASFARRTGRRADDIAVLTLAGAVFGAGIAVWLSRPADAMDDYVELFDATLAQLEAGLTLQGAPRGGSTTSQESLRDANAPTIFG
jgi:AcrR family transcriptional regulator